MYSLRRPAPTPQRGDRTRDQRIVYNRVKLDDGRMVVLFVNRDTNLVVLDVVDADESGGRELCRVNV